MPEQLECDLKMLKTARRELFIEKQRREIATEYLNCAFWEYDIEKNCQYQYKKLDGKWSENKATLFDFRNTTKAWGLIHPDDMVIFDNFCDSLENGESDFVYDLRLYSDDNEFIKIRYTGKAVYDEEGKAISVVGVTYQLSDEESSACVPERNDADAKSADRSLKGITEPDDNEKKASLAKLSVMESEEKRLFNYAFDTLNGEDDIYTSIGKIFTEIGKYYDLDSVSLVESAGNDCAVLSKTWQKKKSGYKIYEFEKHLTKYWNEMNRVLTINNSVLVCNDLSELDNRDFFNDRIKLDTKSLVISGIYDSKKMIGYIAFDSSRPREWQKNDVNAFVSITLIISTYLLKHRNQVDLQNEILYSSAILDNQELTSYTINPETFEITYASRYASKMFKGIKLGEPCYKAIMGYNSPCKQCPAVKLDSLNKKSTVEYYNNKYDAWLSTTASEIKRPDGNVEYLMCVSDVTQFIDRVQSHDRLTGLLSFDKFEVQGMEIFDKLSDDYYVAVIKILKFREVNDNYGFDMGNVLLKETAQKFARSVADGEYICRGSGANFFALLKADEDWKVPARLEMIFKAIQEEVWKKYPYVKFYFGSGVYKMSSEDTHFNNALDKANFALKTFTGGKYVTANTVKVYDSELNDDIMKRKEIERTMKSAIDNDEFKVYYQPKVGLVNEKINGAEALVRWIKPDGEIISPAMFVPIFEDNEFITEMDFYVYERVMNDLSMIRDMGKELPVVSVNASRHHLKDDEFAEKFCDLVDRYDIPHDRIEIELTETVFFDDLDKLIGVMKKLRSMGFGISVDDFGTGYSSLNLISILPVDALKIDGNFFKSNQLNNKNKKVISTIFELAKGLNLVTVSEGVETREQIDFLRECCCDTVQGYYYYKPMSLNDFIDVI